MGKEDWKHAPCSFPNIRIFARNPNKRALMRLDLLFFCFFFANIFVAGSSNAQGFGSWESLLERFVTERGLVDYKGLKKNERVLEEVLSDLQEQYPGPKATSSKELAYWINAYNAFAIDRVLQHYPVESIRDIDRAFEKKFIELGKKRYSLNGIEKKIILKDSEDPRLHYAVNCASISCPPLRNEAYKGEKLEQQLNDQAFAFINNSERNKLKEDPVRISKIYDWYSEDFTEEGSLIDHIKRYAEGVDIPPDAELTYKKYDWGLNEKR